MALKNLNDIRTDSPAGPLHDDDIIVVQQGVVTKGGILSQLKTYLFGATTVPANTVLAGPTTGGDDNPSFRALTKDDMPDLSSVYQGNAVPLTVLSSLTPAANKVPVFSGDTTASTLDFSDDELLGDSASSIPSQRAVKAFVEDAVSEIDVDPNLFAKVGNISASGLTMSTARILGRETAAPGAVEELEIGAGLVLDDGVLRSDVLGVTPQKTPDDLGELAPDEDDLANIVAKINEIILAFNALLGTLETSGVLEEP